MAEKNNNLAWALIIGGAALALYGLTSESSQDSGPTKVPPGGSLSNQYGSWTNNTGAAVYLNLAGDILDDLGNIIGNIQSLIPGNYNQSEEEQPLPDAQPTGDPSMAGFFDGGLM